MFKTYLAKLSDLAHNVTNENFVECQKVEADILNNADGVLTNYERLTLCTVVSIIKNDMFKQLLGSGGK